MIIKFKYDDVWIFIDKVCRVTVQENYKENPLTEIHYLNESNGKMTGIFLGLDNEYINIATSDSAYLLNDKGQTIERLV